MSREFYFENGSFFCEGINIPEMFEHLNPEARSVIVNDQEIKIDIPTTPAFLYSSAALKRNVEKYQETFLNCSLNCTLGYAVKANGNIEILKLLKKNGVEMLVTVSGHEILTSVNAGFKPSSIILNGNGKQEWEIKLALHLGTILNVDSKFDCFRISELKRKYFPDKDVKVLLRIRPSSVSHKKDSTVHPYVNTAEESKFGFDVTELEDILKILEEDEKINVFGIHCHLGSCIYDPEVYRSMGDIMLNITSILKSKGHNIKFLDIGGGIGIDYYRNIPGLELPQKKHPNAEELPDQSVFMNVIADVIPKDMNVILEPGRSLVATSGVLVCKVLGTKSTVSKNFIVVDGSMSEIIRPCLYNSFHRIFPTSLPAVLTNWNKYDIVGPICESADFIGRDILMPEVKSGSYLAVMDAGAYCFSMSSNYNMRPRPNEILINEDSYEIIRRRDTYEDLIKTSVN